MMYNEFILFFGGESYGKKKAEKKIIDQDRATYRFFCNIAVICGFYIFKLDI